MTVRLHRGDLPDLSRYGREVAIDTETMGLDPRRDRLCVVQLSPGDGSADVVQIPAGANEAPNLTRLLADPAVTKIFHYARFDVAVLRQRFGVVTGPVYCTPATQAVARIRDWLDTPTVLVTDMFAARCVSGLVERLVSREGDGERLSAVAEVYLEIAAMDSAEVLSALETSS